MTHEPFRSAMSMKHVEETSLALPSDNKFRSGHQRVLDQVHTIRKNRSKYSKSGSGSLSPTSPKTPNAFSEFRLFKYSPTMANGSGFSKGNSNGVTTFEKMVRAQHSFPPNASRRNMSTSSQKYFFPISPGVGGPTGSGQATGKNGLMPSRSNPELAPISTTVQRGASTLHSIPNRASVYSIGNGNSPFIGSNSGQFISSGSNPFMRSNSSHFVSSSCGQIVGSNPGQFLGSNSGQFVGSSLGQLGNGSTHFIGSQSRFIGASSNLSNTESKISLPKVKSEFKANLEGNSMDITMKEAVEYLLSHDENYQHCGASFIQHSTYKEDKAKQEVLRLKGIPSLLALLRSPSAQVQQTVSAALRNLVFKDDSNKQEVQHCGGIAEALNLLKDTDSAETQKQLTGLLWNLSSADNLKPELIKSALPVLTQSILLPFTGSGEQNANNNMDPEVFYNATGCLRNLSCAKKGNRQAIRNSRGLIDSLVSYVQDCVAADRPDDKSVENCVCVLHNLTYQLETEAPSHFSKITALAGTPTRSSARQTSNSASMGCFSQQGSKIPQETTFDYPVIEDSNPKGVGWLFHSETMQTYLSLLSTSQTDATLEACVGALQNLTASKGIVSSVMSQAIVQKLNGLQLISPHLQSSNPNVQKTAVALVGNLSKNPRLQSSMSRQTLPQLVSLLTSGAQNGADSDDTMAMACQTTGSLLVAEPETGKRLLNNNLINSLNDLSRNSFLPKSSKAAALLLYGLWADKNFQGFFKKQGMNKGSFMSGVILKMEHTC
ncbi:hypothetical protein AAFF_G00409990 [Aldrovandia affinis]|uniref:Plakophilin 1 n=1 Tax=Aldrovandia affinis TaxID=143900 RepID=A0AAD7SC31_9TELE|nr:hypothetical protein AAFF_G00409990 [Aldrovandia affinis]